MMKSGLLALRGHAAGGEAEHGEQDRGELPHGLPSSSVAGIRAEG
jgi:hypothetical protein